MQQTGEQTYQLSFCGYLYEWRRPEDTPLPLFYRWTIHLYRNMFILHLIDAETDQTIFLEEIKRIRKEAYSDT